MMQRIMRCLVCTALYLSLSASPSFSDKLFEAIAQGYGGTKEQAINNAVESAIRKNLGVLLFSVESLSDQSVPHLQDRIIQFSRGTVRKTELVELKGDKKGVWVQVKVTIDPQAVQDTVRSILAGKNTNDIVLKTTPLLDMGQDRIYTFFHLLDFRHFLNVSLKESKLDARKGILNLAVVVSMNDEYFQKALTVPLAAMMDATMKSDGLDAELEQEYKAISDQRAITFFLMERNLSFRGWTLPRAFLESMMRGCGIELFGKELLHTHKRCWLHVSLRDASGVERERVPIPLSLTNVLFFSHYSIDTANPWFLSGLEEQGARFSSSVFCAPYFGIASNRGYLYLKESLERFELHLSPNILAQIKDIAVSLELER